MYNHIDEIGTADLVEMQQFSKWNKGYRYLLMVLIDVFSKYGWIIPLKDKKDETVREAFKGIFKEERKPEYLWTDKGSEFYNKNLKDLLNKQFTIQGNTQYLDILPKLVEKQNNTKHSSIKMMPIEALKNEGAEYFNLYGDIKPLSSKPKFKVGDKVRISKYKRRTFDKGYTSNWTEEVSIVDKIHYTNPITYKIKDLNDEEIQGSFYEPELLTAKQIYSELIKSVEEIMRKEAC